MARHRHSLGDHLMAGGGHRQPRADPLALYRQALYWRALYWLALYWLVLYWPAVAGVRLPRPQREFVAWILGEDVTAGSARAPVPEHDRAAPPRVARRRSLVTLMLVSLMLAAHRIAGRAGAGINWVHPVHGKRIGREKPQACGVRRGPGQGVNEHGLISSRSPWPRPPHFGEV
jgi:hypothetical protein